MASKTIYICDNCGKEQIELHEHECDSIPKGWTYAYGFECNAYFTGDNINTTSNGVIPKGSNNKLFCSKECLKKYVNSYFADKLKKINAYIDNSKDTKSE